MLRLEKLLQVKSQRKNNNFSQWMIHVPNKVTIYYNPFGVKDTESNLGNLTNDKESINVWNHGSSIKYFYHSPKKYKNYEEVFNALKAM
jgi:hypothetical protein